MLPTVIKLRAQTIEVLDPEPARVLVWTAIDAQTLIPVVVQPNGAAMQLWLTANGYRSVAGTNGLWRKTRL
jgi:hypothetical protein